MATQKIHFFTGKGGVGKSTVASAYALYQSRVQTSENKSKILLCELTEEPQLSQFVLPPHPHLNIENWTTSSCLTEYAANLIKSTALTKLFLNNSVSRSLINIAPGLQELAILGKATASPRKHGPPTNYDEIFIDAFSTGHFLQLMTAPQSFTEIFTKGPMASQSHSINEWIRNPDFTKIYIVTTADELSITESLEFFQQLKQKGFQSEIILNKMIRNDQIQIGRCAPLTQQYFKNLIEQQTEAENKIKKLKQKYTKIYFSFKPLIQDIVVDISGFLK